MTLNTKLKKKTGATFTPPKLADFISDKILTYLERGESKIKVLDPACGEGALLSSISAKLQLKNINFELVGFDANKDFLEIAEDNLASFALMGNLSLNQADFLKEIKPEKKQPSLFKEFNNKEFINNTIDVIIANPPYVRTQILGTEYAQEIAKKFNLKGRVDLYYPFLLGMTYALKAGGLVGVITSNRYLSTKSGISIRKFLEENFEILEIIDLGDTKLFDAAVLPAIFIGRKKANGSKTSQTKFTKIYEELNGYEGKFKPLPSIEDVLLNSADGFFIVKGKKYKKTSGVIKYINSKEYSWALLNKEENEWIERIHAASNCTIQNLFKVRVGIKTTADKVFIREDWEALDVEPEETLLRDLISQENIEPWEISTDKKLRALYPHLSVNGKKETIKLEAYPNAKKYFEEHKERLSSRKYLIDAGRNWFEMWVPQNPDFWTKPKLVFPDISTYPRFYFDESGKIVNGNCYWIVAQKPGDIDLLLLIQGISNTLLMTKYHELMFNNKLYSGRRRYFSQFVEKYPIPDINSKTSKDIIDIVKQLNSPLVNQKEKLIKELEIAVATSFGVAPVFSLD